MKSKFFKFISENLSWQFGLLMVFILAISMLGSSLIEFKNSSRITQDTLNSRMVSLGEMLTSISVESLLVDDFVSINDFMLSAVNQQDVVYVVLLGANGYVLSRHINENSMLLGDIRKNNVSNELSELINMLNRHDDVMFRSFPIIFESNQIGKIVLALNRQSYDLVAQKKLIVNFLITLLMSILAGIAIYLTFKRKILKPIKEITAAANHVSHIELNYKIKISGNNELSKLATTFNNMSDHLAQAISSKNLSMEKLQAFNESLEEKIQQRTQDLIDTNELLSHQSNHDILTALPNRALGLDRLRQNLINAKRFKNKAVLFFIDLDRFKNINDTLGHAMGDQVLIETARRLVDVVRAGDTVARIGGDEFLVMLRDVTKRSDIESLAVNINKEINRKFIISERELHIGCSIGIAVGPEDSDDAETLLNFADNAMYKAKELGRNHFQYYTRAMNEEANVRRNMESLLSDALSNGELSVMYQPIIRSKDGQICGAEALLRWNSRQFGFVSPDAFIFLMEESGLITPIGDWVLSQACEMTAYWHEKFDYDGSIAVNISTVQLRTHQLSRHVDNALKNTGLPADKLHLELTESILIEDSSDIVNCLDELYKLGIKFSIDDFGTGYSSLGYLKRFPGAIIKIDKSFTQDINKDKEDEALVDAIIGIGHSLSRELVAEGVETEGQKNFLTERGCEYLQGYYFSKPVTADEFAEMIIECPWPTEK